MPALREVVRQVKIYLAGTYSERKNKEEVRKCLYLLESFYYIQDWQVEIVKSVKGFLLDSGAFTFMQSKKNNVNWAEYIERYADFINQNNVECFFELDIDSVVGYEKVLEYRQLLERLTGKQSIPVWHKSRGTDEFKRMCDEYSYAAIGGIVAREIMPNEYKAFPKMIKEAHERRCKLHGLGFTNTKLLPKYHFDSVDSTRWNCARFGRLEYFNGQTMIAEDRRKDGQRLKGRAEIDGITFTLREWTKYQKWAETHI